MIDFFKKKKKQHHRSLGKGHYDIFSALYNKKNVESLIQLTGDKTCKRKKNTKTWKQKNSRKKKTP